MKVPTHPDEHDLKLYDKHQIRELTGLSVRLIEQHAADPGNPLKWGFKVGRRRCADAVTVKAYLESFRTS